MLLNQNIHIVTSSTNGGHTSIFVIATTATTLWGC